METFREFDSFGDLIPLKEFVEGVEYNCFTPDDGSGYWATDVKQSDIDIWDTKRPEWATHVMWYNK